jgi:hypothetical protein
VLISVDVSFFCSASESQHISGKISLTNHHIQ